MRRHGALALLPAGALLATCVQAPPSEAVPVAAPRAVASLPAGLDGAIDGQSDSVCALLDGLRKALGVPDSADKRRQEEEGHGDEHGDPHGEKGDPHEGKGDRHEKGDPDEKGDGEQRSEHGEEGEGGAHEGGRKGEGAHRHGAGPEARRPAPPAAQEGPEGQGPSHGPEAAPPPGAQGADPSASAPAGPPSGPAQEPERRRGLLGSVTDLLHLTPRDRNGADSRTDQGGSGGTDGTGSGGAGGPGQGPADNSRTAGGDPGPQHTDGTGTAAPGRGTGGHGAAAPDGPDASGPHGRGPHGQGADQGAADHRGDGGDKGTKGDGGEGRAHDQGQGHDEGEGRDKDGEHGPHEGDEEPEGRQSSNTEGEEPADGGAHRPTRLTLPLPGALGGTLGKLTEALPRQIGIGNGKSGSPWCLSELALGLGLGAHGLPDGLPERTSVFPAAIRTPLLVINSLTYHGITEVQTADGPRRVLAFTATRLDIKSLQQDQPLVGARCSEHDPVEPPRRPDYRGLPGLRLPLLDIGLPGIGRVPQDSENPYPECLGTLRTEGAEGRNSTATGDPVVLLTPMLSGNLLGLLPITFTPDMPPPLPPGLTLPIPLFFTDVISHLHLLQADNLQIPGLHQQVQRP